MKRRCFIKQAVLTATGMACMAPHPLLGEAPRPPRFEVEPTLAKDWLARWEKGILGDARRRYCDRELGEELGWLVTPFLTGFYEGYRATHDPKWIDLLVDWSEAWVKRGVKEPDGYVGWPKRDSGGAVARELLTDSLLGEAMALRPLVLMAGEIPRAPNLKANHGTRAEAWLTLAGQVFEKWDSRGCWREVKEGGLWVVPDYGLDAQGGGWTEGFAKRATEGFSNPDNKQNHIALWLLAMHDVTGKPVYRARAEQWFRLMKSRMKLREGGKYFVWNYWEPAGPWDYKPDGSPRHWVGVHPNGGYYGIDVGGITAAFEHGLVFTQEDLQRLIATNRDFMWNQSVEGAKFQRIDGGQPDARWKTSPGVLWVSLVPHDETLRKVFLANHDPASWGGLAVTPWFLAQANTGGSNQRL